MLEAIVAAADPRPGGRILEIGPGLGVLTGALLRAGAAVTAVEVDPRMTTHLRGRHVQDLELGAQGPDTAGGLRLVDADILDTPIGDVIEPPYDLVANLPYHITSPVLHHALGDGPRPGALRADAPARGRGAHHGAARRHELPVRCSCSTTRMSGWSGSSRPRRSSPRRRSIPAIVAGVTRPRRLDDAREEDLWRLVQAGLPRAPEDGPQRAAAPAAAGRSGALLRGAGGGRRHPGAAPQTLSVEEWLALAEVIGPLA